MAETLNLTIVAPTSLVLVEEVTMVVLPGTEGDMGILPHHGSLVTTLRAGLLESYQDTKVTHQLFLSEGFANINERGCTILAEECIFIHDLEKEALEEQLSHTLKDIDMARTEEERFAHHYTCRMLQTKLDIMRRLAL